MTPEQREIVLEEASKLGVSASRYMSIFSNDDCVVKKKVIAPLIDDLEKLVMEDPFVKDDRKVRNEVDRLKTITENPRTKTFYSGEYTTKACMALIHEQHEILQQRAEAMDMSTAEYVRYKLSDNMDAVAKMKIIPPLYSLNKVFGNESYPYTNEEEVLKKIWNLI